MWWKDVVASWQNDLSAFTLTFDKYGTEMSIYFPQIFLFSESFFLLSSARCRPAHEWRRKVGRKESLKQLSNVERHLAEKRENNTKAQAGEWILLTKHFEIIWEIQLFSSFCVWSNDSKFLNYKVLTMIYKKKLLLSSKMQNSKKLKKKLITTCIDILRRP